MSISHLVDSLFGIYWWVIIVRIFLTWLPNIDWNSQPFSLLKALVDPVLSPFRTIIPAVGGLDFSPIVAIIFIQLVQVAIVSLLRNFGL